ncbi:cytochrome c oxidase assembly protein COX16 homolog, mitochondrial isoform X2 [Lutra lutra]|uniref:cytochrome c oxidase assembly protein COX16 homolog, mitochondrial isoform X2 n=1 Tax=Lutra lutra TaxID=9657 RepID=UPI001FD40F17|nr:cytochrome c oxidase assembly protein COX16 homolog, mitochondrial isoform X2 [Lutra lutra]
MSVHSVMRTLRKNKTLRYGVPMLLLIVGGSFGLREFSQIRYDAVKIKAVLRRSVLGQVELIDPELEKKLKMNKISLESEYEVLWGQEIPGCLSRLSYLSYCIPFVQSCLPQI